MVEECTMIAEVVAKKFGDDDMKRQAKVQNIQNAHIFTQDNIHTH